MVINLFSLSVGSCTDLLLFKIFSNAANTLLLWLFFCKRAVTDDTVTALGFKV